MKKFTLFSPLFLLVIANPVLADNNAQLKFVNNSRIPDLQAQIQLYENGRYGPKLLLPFPQNKDEIEVPAPKTIYIASFTFGPETYYCNGLGQLIPNTNYTIKFVNHGIKNYPILSCQITEM